MSGFPTIMEQRMEGVQAGGTQWGGRVVVVVGAVPYMQYSSRCNNNGG